MDSKEECKKWSQWHSTYFIFFPCTSLNWLAILALYIQYNTINFIEHQNRAITARAMSQIPQVYNYCITVNICFKGHKIIAINTHTVNQNRSVDNLHVFKYAKILNWLKVNVKNYTEVLFYKYYIINSLKLKCNAEIIQQTIIAPFLRVVSTRIFSQEPTYKIMAL